MIVDSSLPKLGVSSGYYLADTVWESRTTIRPKVSCFLSIIIAALDSTGLRWDNDLIPACMPP
jgi:hypothetical protein